jgi:dTDP-4-dehydrorhamnose reductase
MLRLGAERPVLTVVDDQTGAPTSAGAIAAMTRRLAKKYEEDRESVPRGLYHMSAGGSTTWCGFARAIFEAAGVKNKPQVDPIPSSAYKTPARRPANSLLANDKFAQTFGFRMTDWREQLDEVLATMKETNQEKG